MSNTLVCVLLAAIVEVVDNTYFDSRMGHLKIILMAALAIDTVRVACYVLRKR